MTHITSRNLTLALTLGLSVTVGAMTRPAAAQTPVQSAPASPPAQAAPNTVQQRPPGTALPPGTVIQGGTLPPGATVPSAAPMMQVPDCVCDYWIVSSRHCNGNAANTGCLNYFHRTSERDMRDVGRDAFMASLRPDLPVCFVVHGSYNWWRDVVKESRSIQKWIRSGAPELPVQIVFFTWPSDGNMPFVFPVDIAVLGRKASKHSLYLANLIGSLPPEQPVCILGHSHGARAAAAALHVLGGGAVEDGQRLPPGYSTPQHLRAVLVAAAIDQSWLNPGNRYGQALWPPERILLMRNSRDTTLAVYPYRKFGGEKAMGKDGLALQDRFQMDQLGRKIVELDAAQFAQSNHSFADYHQHPELAAALVPYVYFRDDGVATTPVTADPALSQRNPAPPKNNGPPATAATQMIQPARPITPAGNQVPAKGPKLTPASLNPLPILEAPPVPADPPADDQPHRIQPKSKPAGESAPAAYKADQAPRKKKWRNPFHLKVEP